MFKPGYNIWNNIPVFAMDYRLESGNNKQALMESIVGHIIATSIADCANIDIFTEYLQSLEAPVHQELADKIEIGKEVIWLALPEFETLSLKEQEAVLHHEHFHILRGDLKYDESEPTRGVIADLEMEKACDAHSVTMMGANYIQTAIEKLLMRSATMKAQLTGVSAQSTYESIINQDEFRLRF